MKKYLLSLALLVMLPFSVAHAAPQQRTFELSCPAGSSPSPNGVSYNPSTNKYRAYQCVDANGTTTWNDAVTNGGGGSGPVGTNGNIQVKNGTLFAPLSANTGCSAGQAPRSINASGNAVNCTPFAWSTASTIYAASFGAKANAVYVEDAVTTDLSATVTSATAHFSTTARVGMIAFATDGNGSADLVIPRSTITVINSDTSITLSNAANLTSPGMFLAYGDSDDTAYTAAFNAVEAAPALTCLVLPSGYSITEKADFLFAETDVHPFGACLKSEGYTVLIPSPAFDFTTCGIVRGACVISMDAATDTHSPGNDVLQNIGLFGLGNSSAGSFVGAANHAAIYTRQTQISNVQMWGWGRSIGNFTAAFYSDLTYAYGVEIFDVGSIACNANGGPVAIVNSWCAGGGLSVAGGFVNSLNSYYQSENQPNIVVGAGATLYSVNDISQVLTGDYNGMSISGTAHFTGMTATNNSQYGTIYMRTGGVSYIRDSSFTNADAGKPALDTSGGGNVYDLGGNTIVGNNNDECVSASGVCGSAHQGAVTIAAAATTVTVATTAVTANSKIQITENATLGTPLSVTCNNATNTGAPFISTITPGTSFVITVPVTPAVNPACYQYQIVNPGT